MEWLRLLAEVPTIALLIYLHVTVKQHQKAIRKFFEQGPPDEHPIEPELTRAELERLQRHREFDERIQRIADELQIPRRPSIEAEELHPLVKNLPHHIISIRPGEAPTDTLEIAE